MRTGVGGERTFRGRGWVGSEVFPASRRSLALFTEVWASVRGKTRVWGLGIILSESESRTSQGGIGK